MCLSVYRCGYVYMCVYMWLCVYVYVSAYVPVCVYVCTCVLSECLVYMGVDGHVCGGVDYVPMCVGMSVYHCVCMPLCVYMFIYMYRGTLACMFMCECKKAISISCLLCYLRQGLSVNLRWTGWPTNSVSPASASPLLGFQVCTGTPDFYTGPGVQNSGEHASTASPLRTKLFPPPGFESSVFRSLQRVYQMSLALS